MPEHVHLLVYPRGPEAMISRIRSAIKEPVARRAIAYLEEHAPEWLAKITVREGQRVRRRFWQPGGGFDRNVRDFDELCREVRYIHRNPVERGLVERPTEWAWSSARWYAGERGSEAGIQMDEVSPGPGGFPGANPEQWI